MQRLLLLLLFLSTLTAPVWAGGRAEHSPATAGSGAPSTPIAPDSPPAFPGFAVVELFTSSGCSSCPPAERVVNDLAHRSSTAHSPVYTLAWHVDYWNSLGWPDPYSTQAATTRQKNYAAAFSSSLATPQAIVNGAKAAADAADAAELERLVVAGLDSPARSAVTLSTRVDPEAGRVRIRTAVIAAPRGGSVLVALVESGLVQNPTAGENAGRKLEESGVVRAFATLPPSGGSVELRIPRGVNLANSRVVALVQDNGTHRIVGANESPPLSGAPLDSTDVRGMVVSRRGNGRSGVLVQACSDTLCIPGRSNAAGRFSLVQVPPGSYTIKLYGSGRVSGPVTSFPLLAERGEQITLPTVVVGS